MDLKERIDADIRAAMLTREKDKLNALRAIKSAILLEQTKEGGQSALDEAQGLKILGKLFKQRQESAAIYRQQGREDLASEEEVQAAVIEAYLPERLSNEEVESVIRELVKDMGATSVKDMGRVMGAANAKLAGKIDGSAVAVIVKKLLSSS